jgi:hypothetical protein
VELPSRSRPGAHHEHDSPGGVVAVVVTLLCVLAGCVLAACAKSTRVTGQVDSVSFGRLCFTPENADRTDLFGCWPVSTGDAAGLQQGDCVSANIPSEETDRVTGIRKLDRPCHIGAEPHVSTSTAIENALLLVGIPAAVVILAVVLPRRRRRRVAARGAGRRANRTAPSPTAVVDVGEPTEVEVIDRSQPGRRSDR